MYGMVSGNAARYFSYTAGCKQVAPVDFDECTSENMHPVLRETPLRFDERDATPHVAIIIAINNGYCL